MPILWPFKIAERGNAITQRKTFESSLAKAEGNSSDGKANRPLQKREGTGASFLY